MDLSQALDLDQPDVAKKAKAAPKAKAARSGSADVGAPEDASDPAGLGVLTMARLCRNCQHYSNDKSGFGDCHNGISGRMQTSKNDKCDKGFFPDVERWPLRAGPGGVF